MEEHTTIYASVETNTTNVLEYSLSTLPVEKNVLGLVDKRNMWLLFGCYCNDPKLLTDSRYETNDNDYNEDFHKILWGCLINIVKKSKVNKITSVEIENEMSMFSSTLAMWEKSQGTNYIERAIEETQDKLYNIDLYFNTVRKYSILRNAVKHLKMDVSFLYNENDERKMAYFNSLTADEVLNKIINNFDNFKQMFKSVNDDNYSFHVGDGINDRIEGYKNQDNTYGFPFQNQYLNTIFRGQKSKKYIIFSSKSGGGKIN